MSLFKNNQVKREEKMNSKQQPETDKKTSNSRYIYLGIYLLTISSFIFTNTLLYIIKVIINNAQYGMGVLFLFSASLILAGVSVALITTGLMLPHQR